MTRRYQVRRGDSLWRIAERECRDAHRWREILSLNQLPNPNLIVIGQTLILPDATPAAIAAGRPGAAAHVQLATARGSVAVPPRPAVATATAPGTDLAAQRAARQLMAPAMEFNLDNVLAPVVWSSPLVTVTTKLKGTLTVQSTCPLEGIVLQDIRSLLIQTRSSYERAVGEFSTRIGSQLQAEYNISSRQLEVTSSMQSEIRFGGETWVQVSAEFVPPAGMKFTYQPRSVGGRLGDFLFAGQVGLEFTVQLTPSRAAPDPVPVVAVAVGLFAIATVIVVATLAEDIATFGAGVADDAISFAAAITSWQAGTALLTAARTASIVVPPAMMMAGAR